MFTPEELIMIYTDQKDALETIHEGLNMCEDVSKCQPQCFGFEDIEDIFLRQSIMNKIEEIGSKKS
ncbi:hypothetical protein LCGC14_1352100 [marine sediment metagenome]|uniref:Uncharacterized protein n=1 Tax=marine sediment metagenome TaxID=412755 RepID=A0A0F9NCT8_9ZZZZ